MKSGSEKAAERAMPLILHPTCVHGFVSALQFHSTALSSDLINHRKVQLPPLHHPPAVLLSPTQTSPHSLFITDKEKQQPTG